MLLADLPQGWHILVAGSHHEAIDPPNLTHMVRYLA